MRALEELLSNRWIIKAENKERYYRIKDEYEDIRKFATEKMGCQIILNSTLIKLEKIPAKAESFMGITEFTSKMEYCFLCIILMFLEDKEAEEQFILSQLTEYIVANITDEKVDWTWYSYRRQLIKVIRFCISNGILNVNDGNDDLFASDYTGEVLYENTGVSKYLMRNFTKDIMAYTQVDDFETSDWIDINEDRGVARRHRVYKRLLMSPGVYRSGQEDEDFEYLKRYGNRMNEEFERTFDCKLQVYRTSAFLIMGNDCRIGSAFPENNSLSDIILLCNQRILSKLEENEIELQLDENIRLSVIQFERILIECKERYGKGFVKSYREKTSSEFVTMVTNQMEHFALIEKDIANQEVLIRPIVGKIVGAFPNDFIMEDTKDE